MLSTSSSSVDSSYVLTRNADLNAALSNVYKYIDIDSTYRNRNNYKNPCDFVIPISYPSRNSNSATSIDAILLGMPYTDSTVAIGSNVTGISVDTSHITLDTNESVLENFYINSILEVSGEFRTITSYNSVTKVATVSLAFSALPPPGTVYYTRKAAPFFVGSVGAVPAPTLTQINLSGIGLSPINNFYVNSYIRFTSGTLAGLTFRITTYDPILNIVTIANSFNSIPAIGDTLELLSYSRDNASTLIFSSGGNTSIQNNYYEIELLWLSIPVQVLNVGYGGTLDSYPYLYVKLYNEGKRQSNQVLYSNNPSSTSALFKVPINQYFGDTYFITLTDSKAKQVVQFFPDQDIRFTLCLPDGTPVNFATPENFSPLEPNPFIQINALFSLKKL